MSARALTASAHSRRHASTAQFFVCKLTMTTLSCCRVGVEQARVKQQQHARRRVQAQCVEVCAAKHVAAARV